MKSDSIQKIHGPILRDREETEGRDDRAWTLSLRVDCREKEREGLMSAELHFRRVSERVIVACGTPL